MNGLLQSFIGTKSLIITPFNIRYLASYLHTNVDIQERIIHLGPVTVSYEKFLEIPLGEIDARATIVITVTLDKSHPNTQGTDSDIVLGISDGNNENLFFIVDINNYIDHSPCYPGNGTHDDIRVTPGTKVPAVFKLTFIPFYKYGACETSQEGGYINTGTFNHKLDTTKPLFLHFSGHGIAEDYYIHYLSISIF